MIGCAGSLLLLVVIPGYHAHGATVTHRPEPRALPARQEVHLHFHGVTAEEVAEVLARVNHKDQKRVD
jgi:hypothetical protein